MLPVYLGVLPEHFWIVMAITTLLVLAVLWGAALLFRRAEY
jgi:hypothetical protein